MGTKDLNYWLLHIYLYNKHVKFTSSGLFGVCTFWFEALGAHRAYEFYSRHKLR